VPACLRPSAPIAADAVLVGDPGRALLLAQELVTQPKMANHARGLWGYWGKTPQGRPLTIQSTGIGAPSAAAVIADLAGLGMRRAVRVGTCAALDTELAVGDLLVVEEAFAGEGVSRALGGGGSIQAPDPQLLDRLRTAAGDGARCGRIASFDLPSEATAGEANLAADQQTSAHFSLAPSFGVASAAVLIVAADRSGEAIADSDLEAAAKAAGRAAATVLSG
jgi:purine-nucleoside phosphorylase